jgi:hypothetical protein
MRIRLGMLVAILLATPLILTAVVSADSCTKPCPCSGDVTCTGDSCATTATGCTSTTTTTRTNPGGNQETVTVTDARNCMACPPGDGGGGGGDDCWFDPSGCNDWGSNMAVQDVYIAN